MFSNNLYSVLYKVVKSNKLLNSNVRLLALSSCRHKSQVPEEDSDAPVQFSRTKAARWSAKHTYGEPFERDIQPPTSQRYVVCISLIILMVYFTMLREENDIDELLTKPLMDFGVTVTETKK